LKLMSFFDNPKNAGLAFMVLAVIEIIGAIIALADAFTADEIKIGAILVGVGGLLSAVLYFYFGRSVRDGMSKIDILANFVMVNGLIYIIGGVFGLVNDVGSGIVSIIIGIIIVLIGKRINDNSQDTFDKIIWIVLLILFILGALGSLFAIFGVFNGDILTILMNVLVTVSSIVVAVFMLLLLFDADVKKQMGM